MLTVLVGTAPYQALGSAGPCALVPVGMPLLRLVNGLSAALCVGGPPGTQRPKQTFKNDEELRRDPFAVGRPSMLSPGPADLLDQHVPYEANP